jgi:transcriptional regulator with XRE-family HTH domain
MDLFKEIAAARTSGGLSQAELAASLGMPRLAVARLESGIGSTARLLMVMKRLEVRLSGIARGGSLPEQLRARRLRRGWTVDYAAARAGLTGKTVQAVEAGGGNAASLSALLSVIAPRAKRSAPPRSSWSFDSTGLDERDQRFTPGWFLEKITSAFGPIDIDPCGHELSAVKAGRRIVLPECGLSTPWSGRLAYVNPPYSAVVTWMERAAAAWQRGETQTIVMLVPTRTDSETYQQRVSREADTLFLSGRIRFESPQGLAWAAPFSLMLLVWGAEEERIRRFMKLSPAARMRPWGGNRSDGQHHLSNPQATYKGNC